MEVDSTQSDILLSYGREECLLDRLDNVLGQVCPASIGIASAFVSVGGFAATAELLRRRRVQDCGLVAGLDAEITHPEALRMALDAGWSVRTWKSLGGMFHPKLLVAGAAILPEGHVGGTGVVYVGSANLTLGGLKSNVECGLLSRDMDVVVAGAKTFVRIWSSANVLTAATLDDYSARFAEASRMRSPATLDDLGVSDRVSAAGTESVTAGSGAEDSVPTVTHLCAELAWVGLASFTGQYTLQVEFPRAAGEVVQRIVSQVMVEDGYVQVRCDDGEVRRMKYTFYPDNSMFRLNIPNTTPEVEWVRQERQGVAVVSRDEKNTNYLRLRIIRPGVELSDLVSRSVALGTWGTTTTRQFGWQ